MNCIFSSYIGDYIVLLDDTVYVNLKEVFVHKRTKWIKWLHGHYLVLFLQNDSSTFDYLLVIMIIIISCRNWTRFEETSSLSGGK